MISDPYSPRSALFAAFSCGALSGAVIRPGRSGAALIAACGFTSPAGAGRFAARAARRAARPVAVRRGPGGVAGDWVVSCPVAWSSTRRPACCGRLLVVAGSSVGGLSSLCARSGLP